MWHLSHLYTDISKPKTSKFNSHKSNYSWQPGCQLVDLMTIALTVKDGKKRDYLKL